MPDKQPARARRIAMIASGAVLLALSLLLIDTTIDIWPAVGAQSELCQQAEKMSLAEREPFLEKLRKGYKVNCRFKDVPITRVNLGGTHTFLSPDQGLVGLVAIFAALGGIVRSLRAMVWSALGWSDAKVSVLWNFLRPFVGAVLALLVYVGVRALFLPTPRMVDVNPYGFIALAAVVGLFCEEALLGVRSATKKG